MMRPVLLEVITPTLSGFDLNFRGFGLMLRLLGLHQKHREEWSGEYPEDWKEAVGILYNWMWELSSLYQHRIRIHVIDAISPLGLWKQIRHRAYHFPAFIVDRKHTYMGWDPEQLESLIDGCIWAHA